MPLYEYECARGHRFEVIRPIKSRHEPILCNQCPDRSIAHLVISRTHWYMGWDFLKAATRRSAPAPNDAGYHPEWDAP